MAVSISLEVRASLKVYWQSEHNCKQIDVGANLGVLVDEEPRNINLLKRVSVLHARQEWGKEGIDSVAPDSPCGAEEILSLDGWVTAWDVGWPAERAPCESFTRGKERWFLPEESSNFPCPQARDVNLSRHRGAEIHLGNIVAIRMANEDGQIYWSLRTRCIGKTKSCIPIWPSCKGARWDNCLEERRGDVRSQAPYRGWRELRREDPWAWCPARGQTLQQRRLQSTLQKWVEPQRLPSTPPTPLLASWDRPRRCCLTCSCLLQGEESSRSRSTSRHYCGWEE